MSQDDPFASSPDSDRTVIIPSPGRRATTPAQAAPSSATPRIELGASVLVGGLNPLIAAANPLLDLVPQLRSTLQHADPSGLRDYLAQNIKSFESRAKAAGVASEKVIAARYALCTLLDETAASTPWGGSGLWAKCSLLVTFHSEAWGGEKFFQLLAKLAENPAGNRDLLEFMYVCLSLGLEGRYRVIDNGKAQLNALTERLAQMLAPLTPHVAEDLWARLGHGETITYESFPVADPALLVDDSVEYPIQVNGKLRSRITVAADADSATVQAAALADP